MLHSPVDNSVQPSPASTSSSLNFSTISLLSALPSPISSSHSPLTASSPSPPKASSPSPSSTHAQGSHALAISVGTIIGGATALLLSYLAVVRWRRQRKTCIQTSALLQLSVDKIPTATASLRSAHSNFAARSNTPSCTNIPVQTLSLPAVTPTHQERAQEVGRLASAIDAISSTPINETVPGANDEMAALHARIVELETQLNVARRENIMNLESDVNDPPPEYRPSDDILHES